MKAIAASFELIIGHLLTAKQIGRCLQRGQSRGEFPQTRGSDSHGECVRKIEGITFEKLRGSSGNLHDRNRSNVAAGPLRSAQPIR
jgi:hypothetical protein